MREPAAEIVRSRSWSDPPLAFLRTGRWRWPWAIIGSAIIVSGAIGLMALGDAAGLSEPEMPGSEIFIAGRPRTFVSLLAFAAALILPTVFAVRVVHGNRLRPMLGPDGRFDWRLFAKAASASLLLAIIGLGIEAVHQPEQFSWQAHPAAHLLWMFAGAAVIVPQAFAEDFVFKGYLLRTLGALLPWRSLIAALVAAVFTSLHAINDDLKADLYFGLISFFATELLAIAVYLRTWSLAATTGLHWANNVFAIVLVARPPGYVSEFPPIVFKDSVLAAGGTRLLDPWAYLEVTAGIVLLWALLTWPRSPFYLPKAGLPATASEPPATDAPPISPDAPPAT